MQNTYALPYPRRRIGRFILRLLFRLLLSFLFKVEIRGKENFPKKGPLLVVGNHTGAMEVVLLNAYAPLQIEMLSAADMPTEKITEIINTLYGSIPINRGSYDRNALSKALDVLGQDGIVGLFPEGGVWEIGKQKALPGISWLSYRSGASIIPVGFNNTEGAMGAGLKLKRPDLIMNIGMVLPPAQIPAETPKKIYFQTHAAEIMDAVYTLVPEDGSINKSEISNEWFEMELNINDGSGENIDPPANIQLVHSTQLGKILHRPAILDIFKTNLDLPTHPLEILAKKPGVEDLIIALKSILNYLENDNPNMLTYRFGIPEGLAMQKGLEELLQILDWCSENGKQISITAVRHYHSISDDKDVIQREQDVYQPWM